MFRLLFILSLVTICSCGTSSYDYDDASSSEDVEGECRFEDGEHSATVDYYNPDTGHSATYSLNVEVKDCQVVQINFPKGGWLDTDHISPSEIDEDGNASVEDDEGRTYGVQIDN